MEQRRLFGRVRLVALAVTAIVSFAAHTPVAAQAGGCVYPAGFALVQGMDARQEIAGPKPAKGAYFSDPNYGLCVVRATDHVAEGASGALRNDYSRRQAFNAGSTRFLVYGFNGGYWYLYDVATLQRVKTLPGLGGDAEPQWHPTNPDLLYFIPTNGGLVLYELNVVTNARRTVGDFTGRLPWAGVAHVWTKSEGSPSADGRYWAFMAEDASFNTLGLFTWDLQTDTIVGTLTVSTRPDHISMSPSGLYVVPSWDAPKGTWAYSRDFATSFRLHTTSEHSDLAFDANGDDTFVSVDYGPGDVFMVNLRTRVRTTLFPTYLNSTATAMHFSGKAFARPGWVLVSTYADYGGTVQWLHRKIFAVELSPSPRLLMIAHHHVNPYSGGYWDEPHATVNRDFTRIAFNSNWNTGSASDVDDYLIQLPDASSPPPPPPPPSSFTLSVTRAGTGAGTVTSSPAGINCGSTCSASYSDGTSVTLAAVPAAGSSFAGWSGSGCSGTGACNVTLTATTSVQATFTATPPPPPPASVKLTVKSSGFGVVTVGDYPIGCVNCWSMYASGAVVTLRAAPNANSKLIGWSGGACSGTSSTCTVKVGVDTTVTATFTK